MMGFFPSVPSKSRVIEVNGVNIDRSTWRSCADGWSYPLDALVTSPSTWSNSSSAKAQSIGRPTDRSTVCQSVGPLPVRVNSI
mgnify:CR=1 FL=1